VIDSVLAVYPNSRFVKWSLARLHEKQERYVEAAEVYAELAEAYDTIAPARRSAALTYSRQAYLYEKAGNHGRSREVCARLLRRYGSSQDPYVKEIVRDVARLKERLDRNDKS
jgi:tetratricopeptide (TPR) repeat protein